MDEEPKKPPRKKYNPIDSWLMHEPKVPPPPTPIIPGPTEPKINHLQGSSNKNDQYEHVVQEWQSRYGEMAQFMEEIITRLRVIEQDLKTLRREARQTPNPPPPRESPESGTVIPADFKSPLEELKQLIAKDQEKISQYKNRTI